MKTILQNDQKLGKLITFITTLTILWSVIIVENCGILAHYPNETNEIHRTNNRNDLIEYQLFKNLWEKVDRLYKRDDHSDVENSNTYAAVRG